VTEPLAVDADYRERYSETARILAASGAAVRFTALKVGDYRVGGRVLIERKAAWDMRQSLFDGRLFRQAYRLARAPTRALLIIDGKDRTLRVETWTGALATLAVVFGLPVLFADTPADSAQWILTAARQLAARNEQAYARPGWRPKGKRARQIFVLQGLPGVGRARAEALLDRFGSVRAVLAADEKALLEVPGIGLKTARKIVWISS